MSDKISDSIFAALREQIITGDLPAGEKLRQDHIARAFGASHVPVREALLRLEGHGLALSEPRRGMRVTVLNPSEMREVTEMRLALEPVALRHAAAQATPMDLRAMESARQACDEAGEMGQWEKRNRAFHRLILAPCALRPAPFAGHD